MGANRRWVVVGLAGCVVAAGLAAVPAGAQTAPGGDEARPPFLSEEEWASVGDGFDLSARPYDPGRPSPPGDTGGEEPAGVLVADETTAQRLVYRDASTGSETQVLTAAPVRFADDQGDWVDYDLGLAEGPDGSLVPAAADNGFTVAGEVAADGELARVDSPAGEFSVGVPDVVAERLDPGDTLLPEVGAVGFAPADQTAVVGRGPVRAAVAGLVSGFEQSVVFDTRRAAGDGAYRMTFSLPAGVTAEAAGADGVVFVDGDGERVGWFGGGMAFDSNPAGPAAGTVGVSLVSTAAAEAVVEVVVGEVWLDDPARVFPVVVDPTFIAETAEGGGVDQMAADTPLDTFVRTTWTTQGELRPDNTPYGGAAGMVVGRVQASGFDTTQWHYRSLLRFPVAAAAVPAHPDRVVTDARLKLSMIAGAGECGGFPVEVRNASEPWTNDQGWSNQPDVYPDPEADPPEPSVPWTTQNWGCGAAGTTTEFQVANAVQPWLDGSRPNYGFRLAAVNEAAPLAPNTYRYFHSSENGESAKVPTLTVTYQYRPPLAATVVSPDHLLTWPENASNEPTFAVAPVPGGVDGDGHQVQYGFFFYTEEPQVLADGTLYSDTPFVHTSGWLASPAYTPPLNTLTANTTYHWVVVTSDGYTYPNAPRSYRTLYYRPETGPPPLPDIEDRLFVSTTEREITVSTMGPDGSTKPSGLLPGTEVHLQRHVGGTWVDAPDDPDAGFENPLVIDSFGDQLATSGVPGGPVLASGAEAGLVAGHGAAVFRGVDPTRWYRLQARTCTGPPEAEVCVPVAETKALPGQEPHQGLRVALYEESMFVDKFPAGSLPTGVYDTHPVESDALYGQSLTTDGDEDHPIYLADTTLVGVVNPTGRQRHGYLRMRDGTRLSVNVRFPKVDGLARRNDGTTAVCPNRDNTNPDDAVNQAKECYPTILLYSPYGPGRPFRLTDDAIAGNTEFESNAVLVDTALAQGYAVIGVDVRGSGCSGGSYSLFGRAQAIDGYDVVQTIARQPWSDGRVGMVGASHPGFTELMVASTNPPALEGVVPAAAASRLYDRGLSGGVPDVFAGNIMQTYMVPTLDPLGQGTDPGFHTGAVPRYAGLDAWVRHNSGAWGAGQIDDAPFRAACARNQLLRGQNWDSTPLHDNLEYEGFGDPEVTPIHDFFLERSPAIWARRVAVPTLLQHAWQDEGSGGTMPMLLEHLGSDIRSTGPAGVLPESYYRLFATNGTHVESDWHEFAAARMEFLSLFVAGRVPTAASMPGTGTNAGAFITTAEDRPFGTGEVRGAGTFDAGPSDRIIAEYADPARDTLGEALAHYQSTNVEVLFENGHDPAAAGHAGHAVRSPYAAPGARAEYQVDTSDGWTPDSATVTDYHLEGVRTLTTTDPDPATGADRWSFRYQPRARARSTNPLQVFGRDSGDHDIANEFGHNWEPLPDGTGTRFQTSPLATNVAMAGTGTVELVVDARAGGQTVDDVDLQVTLSEVRPSGEEIFVQNGWLRLSQWREVSDVGPTPRPDARVLMPRHVFHEFYHDPRPISDGPRHVRVLLQSFGHVFRSGSRLALTVSAPGGDQPHSFYNPRHFEGTAGGEPIEVRIYENADPLNRSGDTTYGSRLRLPVVTTPAGVAPTAPSCMALRAQACRADHATTYLNRTNDLGWSPTSPLVRLEHIDSTNDNLQLDLADLPTGEFQGITLHSQATATLPSGATVDSRIEVWGDNGTTGSATLALTFHDATGALLGSAVTASGTVTTAHTQTAPLQLSTSAATAPSGAAYATTTLVIQPTAGTTFGVDNASLRRGLESGGTPTELLLSRQRTFDFTAGPITLDTANSTATQLINSERFDGLASLRLDATNTPSSIAFRSAAVTVTPSTTYTAGAFVKAATTSRNTRAFVEWYDTSGGLIATRVYGTRPGDATDDTTTNWRRIQVTAAAPAGAHTARYGIELNAPIGTTLTNGEAHYLDGLTFTCDGPFKTNGPACTTT